MLINRLERFIFQHLDAFVLGGNPGLPREGRNRVDGFDRETNLVFDPVELGRLGSGLRLQKMVKITPHPFRGSRGGCPRRMWRAIAHNVRVTRLRQWAERV